MKNNATNKREIIKKVIYLTIMIAMPYISSVLLQLSPYVQNKQCPYAHYVAGFYVTGIVGMLLFDNIFIKGYHVLQKITTVMLMVAGFSFVMNWIPDRKIEYSAMIIIVISILSIIAVFYVEESKTVDEDIRKDYLYVSIPVIIAGLLAIIIKYIIYIEISPVDQLADLSKKISQAELYSNPKSMDVTINASAQSLIDNFWLGWTMGVIAIQLYIPPLSGIFFRLIPDVAKKRTVV